MSDLIGNELPNETLVFMDKDKGPQPLKILDFCKENADKIKEKAIDEIICFATNDIFTMSAWEEMSGSNGKIKFLSDSKAEFAKSLGTDYPDTFGTSIKTKRCSLLVNDGIIEKFFVEVDGGKVDVSGANKMMELL